MAKVGLTEKMRFEQRLEGGGVNQMAMRVEVSGLRQRKLFLEQRP